MGFVTCPSYDGHGDERVLTVAIAKLDLKYLSPVSEGSKEQTAFDQLVLPKQHKDIVYCLVDQHFRNKEARVSDNEEVDIIRGKGSFPP